MDAIDQVRSKAGFIIDMDGVIYHGNRLIPGVTEFIQWLEAQKKKYLFLTNSSERSPRELQQKLERLGIGVGEEHFYTSALATAAFLKSQMKQPASSNPLTPSLSPLGRGEGVEVGGSVFVIGDSGLINALYDAGFTMNDVNPDYVVVGESKTYTYDKITHAIRLVLGGAKLIGTNPDVTGPTDQGLIPATGALMAPIELATGAKAYYVGKPNPLIMRNALKKIDCRREDAVIIGDRMDTDIIAGIESEIETVLVLSGVTAEGDLKRFAYRPDLILKTIAEITGKN